MTSVNDHFPTLEIPIKGHSFSMVNRKFKREGERMGCGSRNERKIEEELRQVHECTGNGAMEVMC